MRSSAGQQNRLSVPQRFRYGGLARTGPGPESPHHHPGGVLQNRGGNRGLDRLVKGGSGNLQGSEIVFAGTARSHRKVSWICPMFFRVSLRTSNFFPENEEIIAPPPCGLLIGIYIFYDDWSTETFREKEWK